MIAKLQHKFEYGAAVEADTSDGAQLSYLDGVEYFGELRLLVAVLERAVSDASGNTGANGDDYDRADAHRWIELDENEDKPAQMSFIYICQHLGLDHNTVRKRIMFVVRNIGYSQHRLSVSRLSTESIMDYILT